MQNCLFGFIETSIDEFKLPLYLRRYLVETLLLQTTSEEGGCKRALVLVYEQFSQTLSSRTGRSYDFGY